MVFIVIFFVDSASWFLLSTSSQLYHAQNEILQISVQGKSIFQENYLKTIKLIYIFLKFEILWNLTSKKILKTFPSIPKGFKTAPDFREKTFLFITYKS